MCLLFVDLMYVSSLCRAFWWNFHHSALQHADVFQQSFCWCLCTAVVSHKPSCLFMLLTSCEVYFVYWLKYISMSHYWNIFSALASWIINAQPLLAHCPAADDSGCTRPWPDRWLVASQCPFRWQLMPVWVHSFIEPDVLKTMYRSTIPLRFIWSICSGN